MQDALLSVSWNVLIDARGFHLSASWTKERFNTVVALTRRG